ncbi:CAF1 family ribonuclease-domain-containing protein [Halteromyces radiatus]|uniref:CAF1 family ribonuclease-domain-containing protein n=1 Tax=Halteromyces radiatus TaxID=101107 RepID=UPI00221EE5C9|nr:CAF1 family ribonuclease-domain-containing protein [Halteromyces radiatus]KAI8097110.1 CAF1 family ribonuclease-domain-containing protein [Halteromyces radiatus]
MEILKKEFEEALPNIRETLLEADFIAVDAEFSGLATNDVKFQNGDDIQQRYSKIQSHVQAFEIVQYGVCAFKKTDTCYVAKPFNFYVFGSDNDNVQSHRTFLSSASSLSFLRSNNFDFNKLIDEGIPFYNYSEERSLFTTTGGYSIIGRHPVLDDTILNKHQRQFLENLRNNLANWLQNGTGKPLLVPTNNGTQRKLVYQEIQQGRYNGFLKASPRDSRNLEITKIDAADRFQKSSNSPQLNFRHVIEAIRDSNCPVVIHNGMYDICHTVDQFWHNLPENVNDFKQLVGNMWNKVVDTKYMAEFHPILKNCFNTSVLGSLFNTVEEELRKGGHIIRMGDGFDRYSVNGSPESCHEAGYDAYMTGIIYLGFIYYIKEKEEEELEKRTGEKGDIPIDGKYDNSDQTTTKSTSHVTSSNPEELKVNSEAGTTHAKEPIFYDTSVTPFYNKIFLMRCDNPYIDLQGQEITHGNIQRNRFFLNNIPTGLTNAGIERLYPEIQPIYVSWINDNTAWITVKHPNKIELVKLGMLGMDRVRDFTRSGTRYVEGEAFRITSQAAEMELLTGDQWEALQQNTSTSTYIQSQQQNGKSTTTEQSIVSSDSLEKEVSSSVPSGGASYDEFDIPLPPSFRATKREHPSSNQEKDTKRSKA